MKKYLFKLFIFILLGSTEIIFAGSKQSTITSLPIFTPFEEIEVYSPAVESRIRLQKLMEMPLNDFVKIIRKRLGKIMSPGSQSISQQQRNTGYKPQIFLSQWIKNIIFIGDIPREVIICTIIYLERLVSQNKEMKLTRNDAYILFLVATMLSSKMHEDITYRNLDWRILGGRAGQFYNIEKLNRIEREIAGLLHYRLHIEAQEFYDFIITIDLSQLEKH